MGADTCQVDSAVGQCGTLVVLTPTSGRADC